MGYAAYDWAHFPKNGVVVDVGCGIGNVALELSKIRHDLMFVLEDQPAFIEYARAVRFSRFVSLLTWLMAKCDTVLEA